MKFQRLPGPVGQGYRLVEYISVARVRPRTSKGITDLLLLSLSQLDTADPSKKIYHDGHPSLSPTARGEARTRREISPTSVPSAAHPRHATTGRFADFAKLPQNDNPPRPDRPTERHAREEERRLRRSERRRPSERPSPRKPRGKEPLSGVDPPTN